MGSPAVQKAHIAFSLGLPHIISHSAIATAFHAKERNKDPEYSAQEKATVHECYIVPVEALDDLVSAFIAAYATDMEIPATAMYRDGIRTAMLRALNSENGAI